MHLFFDTLPEEKKNTMENKFEQFECINCGIMVDRFEYNQFGVCAKCFDKDFEKAHAIPASGSVAAPKDETNIDDNPATYTHFDMLAMVARQTKHMFEENEQLREALKELLPIAEDRLFSVPVTSLDEVEAIIERARKLISK